MTTVGDLKFNFSSVSHMYNCQNSKEIEPLKPSVDLLQVDENCIF